jgi:UDP-N-acetylglucosamine 2-epimerase (non-hydrolysing)
MTELAIILGTRPEIIKLSPVIRECDRRNLDYTLIHTGQHYSDNLDSVFFEKLDLPASDYNLEVGSKSHGKQTAEMIAGIESILLEEEPDTVLVQGDTNSVLAGAIATSKLDLDLGHVEAGLRSFDDDMPEETNRVLTDHTADHLFAPTEQSAAHLREEGIPSERIHVTGNTAVGAVQQNRTLANRKSSILAELGLEGTDFALMTAHRAENVDDEERFADILEGVQRVASEYDLEVIYPIHPRAGDRLDEFDFDVPERIRVIEPADYLDFLTLETEAELAITDSGGVQEETCILGVPCVTVRDNTERPETVDVGANLIVGTDPADIVNGATEMLDRNTDWENPFGDGTAGEQIVRHVQTAPVMEVQR